ncbi:MAG: hypothetical protein RL701_5858 [Pseudomonadota bacterium]
MRLRWLVTCAALLAVACGGDAPAPAVTAGHGGASGTPSMPNNTADQAAAGGAAETYATDDAGPAADSGDTTEAQEILTQRYDNARTGANLHERLLTPNNVKQLSQLGSWFVDGEIYGQVLVAADVDSAGTKKSIAIVATMNDSVFAFDADAPPEQAFLWQTGADHALGTPGFCARNVAGPNGILATPVIDKTRGDVFVVARDCDPSFPDTAPRCQHRLVQLDLHTGEVLASVAVQGDALVPAADGGNDQRVVFAPSAHWNRPGLALAGDELIVAFGSGPAGDQHEEDFVYHGWVFRYDVRDLKRAPQVYCTTPSGRGGSVWQAGAAPALDESGIYFTGANGIQADSSIHPPSEWPRAPVGQEDSVIRLTRAPDFAVQQYWDARAYTSAGNVFQHMESGDNGFGSSGPTLIPDTRLLLVGSKAGLVYLLDRDSMAELQAPLNPFTDQPLQPGHTQYLHSWWGIPMLTQAFVFWRPETKTDARRFGYAYAWASNDRLRQLRFDYEQRTLTLTRSADVPALAGGGNLVLSAAGSDAASGVLWAATRSGSGQAKPQGTLWAFDPLTLAVLWQAPTPAWAKFNPPTVVRGRVFLPSTAPETGTAQQVLVYGLN